MLFADYPFYKNTYYGTRLSESEYPGYAQRASAYLNAVTWGRAERAVTSPGSPAAEAVRFAACAAAEEYYKSDNSGISSESTDGYSVTYSGGDRTLEKALKEAARLYLAPTGLLYRGGGNDRCL